MSHCGNFLISLAILAGPILSALILAADAEKVPNAEKKVNGRFTIGKETTYVDGPLDKDGYIDYLSALNERLRKGIKPDDNAYVVLCKAIGPHPEGAKLPKVFEWLGIDPPLEKGDYFVGSFRFGRDTLKLDSDKDRDEFEGQVKQASQRPWTTKEFPRVAAWLKVNEKPLAIIAEAHKRPRYYCPLVLSPSASSNTSMIGVMLPSAAVCREVGRTFVVRAMLRCGQNEDGAWDDLLACHRIGDLIGRGATLIELLIGASIQSVASRGCAAWLQHGQPTVEQLVKAMDELRKLPLLDIASKVDLAERFFVLETVMLTDREGFDELKKGKKNNPRALQVLEMMNWDQALLAANRWCDRLTAAMRENDRAKRKAKIKDMAGEGEALAADFRKLDPDKPRPFLEKSQARTYEISHLLLSLMFPPIAKVEGTADRVTQERTNLIVAFALELYRRDNKGYPKELAALVPKYLKQVPSDLFTGKDLIYRPNEKGYLLYSVGVNEKDDEGRGHDDTPRGDDLSIRMPSPEGPKK